MNPIKPIRTEADYQQTLARIESIFAAPGTPELDELDVIATLMESYEAAHYFIPDPLDI